MQRYSYESLESKKWSMTTVLSVTALVAVCVGAAVGLVAGNAASTTLYAPATTVQSTVAPAAVPVARRAMQVGAGRGMAEPVESVEQVVYEAPQATFNWAPVAALIALPTAIAAFLLRKAEQAPVATAGVAAATLLASGAMMPMPANAEAVAGLVPCAESKQFQKQLKKEIKAIEKREKLYTAGSEPYLALEATKARTQTRFANYAKSGLLCGTDDGLPHLISDPGLAVRYGHAGETLIPTFGFLYVAGYIGTAGRTYLQEISSRQKPTQSEIIIDVPLATSIAFRSWNWPGKAVEELVGGKLLEKPENIPVSRR